MKNDNIKSLYKGAIIGGTMLVPGVSGGSMAMILGIYDKLISSVSLFFKDMKKNFIFLLLFVVGAVIGMVIFAKPLLVLIESHTFPMMYFFIGAVAGGVPMIYKHANCKNISWKDMAFVVTGVISVIALTYIPKDVFVGTSASDNINFILQIIAGIIAAVALVLPGISVSYMLLLMGVYDKTVYAVSEFDIKFLLPMAIGLLVGIILITRLLENIMRNYPRVTYLVILGFILGSVIQVFPGIPNGYDCIICFLLTLAGYNIIRILSKEE